MLREEIVEVRDEIPHHGVRLHGPDVDPVGPEGEDVRLSRQAAGLPLITMPQEPQMPMLQLYRMARVLSCRSFTERSMSRTVLNLSACTSNVLSVNASPRDRTS